MTLATVESIIAQAAGAGVELWADGPMVRWRSSTGLPDALKAGILGHKPALLRLLAEREADVQEAVDERAAICEHDGGLPRAEADALADLAERFHRHHWSCASCRAGTQVGAGLHRPCPEGALLWTAYAKAAADARGTKKSWSKQ